MEDTRWLRLVTIGLVLAAMAVGYFLLSQRFANNKVSESSPKPTSVLGVEQSPQPSPAVQIPKSAYQRIVERTKGGVQQLPATGFPTLLVGVFSAVAVIAGLGLRKFPY